MRETTEEECVDSSMAAKCLVGILIVLFVMLCTLAYPLCWVAEQCRKMAKEGGDK